MSTEARTANYLRLRSALAGFQRTPAELNDDERRTVEQQTVQAYAIEERVLAMPEARDVHVPAPVVEQAVEGIVERYPEHAEFEADLGGNGLDPHTLPRAGERERPAHRRATRRDPPARPAAPAGTAPAEPAPAAS